LGFIVSTQFDVDLRNSYQVDPVGILDAGPALTFGHKFMDGALSAGMTAHASYRFSAQQGFSFADLLRGRSISPAQSGGQGAGLDFDIGGTYEIPLELGDWKLAGGAAINNLLGGKFTMFNAELIKNNDGTPLGAPIPQRRALGRAEARAGESLVPSLISSRLSSFRISETIPTAACSAQSISGLKPVMASLRLVSDLTRAISQLA